MDEQTWGCSCEDAPTPSAQRLPAAALLNPPRGFSPPILVQTDIKSLSPAVDLEVRFSQVLSSGDSWSIASLLGSVCVSLWFAVHWQ